jgi:GT2 family glycosyltransferase
LLDISIVVVNWNTKDLLQRALSCIYSTVEDLSHEVIVVDNNSDDGSQEMLQTKFPQVRLIQNRENVGFARANNQGLAIAEGRYLLLLNSDAFLQPGALKTMVRVMDAFPDTGAAGCRLYYEDGSLQPSAYSFSTLSTELWQALWLDRLFPSSRLFGKYRMSYWHFDDQRVVDWVMGACILLRADAIRQVGGLDERFFMYSEEMDLCYRLKQAGWKVRFIPNASAIHVWGGSSYQLPEQTFLRLYNSRALFFRKHYGPVNAWLYKLLLAFSSLVRVAVGLTAAVVKPKKDISLSLHNYWRLMLLVWGF